MDNETSPLVTTGKDTMVKMIRKAHGTDYSSLGLSTLEENIEPCITNRESSNRLNNGDSSSAIPMAKDGTRDNDDESVVVIDIEEAIDRLGMGMFQIQIIVACGLCFASDAMEILLLSFLAVILQSEWDLSEGKSDSIISVVFLGALIGTLFLSPLGDRWGRRPVFAIIAATISLFGILTAFCTSYPQILMVRFMVGVGVGGLTVPYDALGEFMPNSFRGPNMLSTSYFWTVGSLMVPFFAWLTLGNRTSAQVSEDETQTSDGAWRVFVVICAIPCLLSTVLGILLVPESPRWLLTQGKHEEALRILRQAAAKNRKDPFLTFPEETLVIDHNIVSGSLETKESEGNTITNNPQCMESSTMKENAEVCGIKRETPTNRQLGNDDRGYHSVDCTADSVKSRRSVLCSDPKWRKISILMGGQWYGLAFMYYGTIRAVSIVFSSIQSDGYKGDDANGGEGDFDFDYVAFLITSSAEAVGLTLAITMVNRIGRVSTQVWSYTLGGFCLLLLGLLNFLKGSECVDLGDKCGNRMFSNRGRLIAFAFLSRMFVMAATSVTWLHTAELLPTDIRATGHGVANTLGRIGGITCPFIVTRDTPLQAIGLIMFVVSILTSGFVKSLPETTGKVLGNFSVSWKGTGDQLLCIPTSSEGTPEVHVMDNSSEGPFSLGENSIDESRTSTNNNIQKKTKEESAVSEKCVSSFELV